MAGQQTKEITLRRVINAPRQLVFQAWTDPELLAKWWGPRGVTNPECEIDLRPGGELNVVMLAGEAMGELAGQRWPMKATFKEIVEPEKLVFINQALDNDGNILIEGIT